MPIFDITGFNKAIILKNFYNIGKVSAEDGFGGEHKKPMTIAEAEELLKEKTSFDHINGVFIKINLTGNNLCTDNFDHYYNASAGITALMKSHTEMEKIKKNVNVRKTVMNEK